MRLGRFRDLLRRTANAGAGAESRHHACKFEAPPNPMDWAEATQIVRDRVPAWIESNSKA